MSSPKIIILSDGTGETAATLSRAIMIQFKNPANIFSRHKNVRTKEQVDAALTEAAVHHALVMYTIVDSKLRQYTEETALVKKIWAVNIIGPALNAFSQYLQEGPKGQPGILHQVDDDYFKRMEAIEFTLKHDNGQEASLESFEAADIILVGGRRTSKTPLSLFLSLRSYKVINVPIQDQVPLPKELLKVDQKKIFGLIVDAQEGWVKKIFDENKRWPIFSAGRKPLEEIALGIIQLIDMRHSNAKKQIDANRE